MAQLMWRASAKVMAARCRMTSGTGTVCAGPVCRERIAATLRTASPSARHSDMRHDLCRVAHVRAHLGARALRRSGNMKAHTIRGIAPTPGGVGLVPFRLSQRYSMMPPPGRGRRRMCGSST